MCPQKALTVSNATSSLPNQGVCVPGIQPYVNQLIIIQRDLASSSGLIRHLQVARLRRSATGIFIRIDAPYGQARVGGIARRLYLDGSVPADDNVLEYLL